MNNNTDIFIFLERATGSIPFDQLGFALRAAGILISQQEINKLRDRFPKGVNQKQYLALLEEFKDKKPIKEDIFNALSIFDENKTGYIDQQELINIVTQMGDVLIESDIKQLLISLQKNGQVSMKDLVEKLM